MVDASAAASAVISIAASIPRSKYSDRAMGLYSIPKSTIYIT